MSQQNQQLIRNFYTAFQQRDYAGMNAYYHPEVHFSDPAFGDLHDKQAMAMWHMLCERGTDLQLSFRDVVATQNSGSAHWEATYTFSTGRMIHNQIDTQFTFADGKIVRHEDSFDLWRWTRMALGLPGLLAGWTPMMQKKVRDTAVSQLNKFIAKHPEYQT